MSFIPTRKIDTAKYPTPAPGSVRLAQLAYLLYCVEMRRQGSDPVAWGSLSESTRAHYREMAAAALEFREDTKATLE